VGTGFSDKQREAPPPVGAIVTFRYQELTKAGVPRFPSFLRVRPDTEWEQAPGEARTTGAESKRKAKTKTKASGTKAKAKAKPKTKASATKAKAKPKTKAKAKAKPKTATSTAAKAGGASGRRYFEFVEGSSSKFWEITVAGSEHTVRYGRIGSDGRALTKSFASPAAAAADAETLIGKKTAKGYVEQG